MKTPARKNDGYTVANPTHCDAEILPYDWHTFAEQKGIGDEDIYKHWSRWKSITRYPFQRRLWEAYVTKIACNRNAARAP